MMKMMIKKKKCQHHKKWNLKATNQTKTREKLHNKIKTNLKINKISKDLIKIKTNKDKVDMADTKEVIKVDIKVGIKEKETRTLTKEGMGKEDKENSTRVETLITTSMEESHSTKTSKSIDNLTLYLIILIYIYFCFMNG